MSEISIPIGSRRVKGREQHCARPCGTIVFIHGSGVDRHDARNQYVGDRLQKAGFATVMLDLLEPREAREGQNVFDIELQAERLLAALERLDAAGKLCRPVGFFATGIGAGVALLAAAQRPNEVGAVVIRSGRPDTALFRLQHVQAPTLLIVDAPDPFNEAALDRLPGEKALVVVPSASHKYREASALGAVARHALRWFSRHLAGRVGVVG